MLSVNLIKLYYEWYNENNLSCITLSVSIGKVIARMLKLQGRLPAEAALIYTMHEGAQGSLPMRVGGATSQLDLPSLTPLSVAGCGWLQLGVSNWAASVDNCK